MEEKHLTELEDGLQNSLLNTIRVPKNLHFLTERLPKPNYLPLRTRKVDKHKFLQTLAGYRDHSNVSMFDEAVRGSESVDSYKKDKDHGRIYLPPVGKEIHSKDIAKIYGHREKRDASSKLHAHGTKIPGPDSEIADSEIASVRKNVDLKKRKKKNIETDEDKEIITKERVGREREVDNLKRPIVANRIAYKVHDLNQDAVFEKHIASIKNIYGGKSNSKIPTDVSSIHSKDPINAMIKRHKNQIMGRSPSQEYFPFYILIFYYK